MPLTANALLQIKKQKRIRSLLALALNRTEYTVIRWAEQNNDNLTKAAALQIIRQETGLADHEILDILPGPEKT